MADLFLSRLKCFGAFDTTRKDAPALARRCVAEVLLRDGLPYSKRGLDVQSLDAPLTHSSSVQEACCAHIMRECLGDLQRWSMACERRGW